MLNRACHLSLKAVPFSFYRAILFFTNLPKLFFSPFFLPLPFPRVCLLLPLFVWMLFFPFHSFPISNPFLFLPVHSLLGLYLLSVIHFFFSDPSHDIPPSVLLLHFLDHISTHLFSTHVSTFTSKSISGTGFAVVFPFRTYNFTPESSDLSTELQTILYGLQCMSSSCFTIFTNSRNSVSLLQTCINHVGIPGNEQTYALALSTAYPHTIYPVFHLFQPPTITLV